MKILAPFLALLLTSFFITGCPAKSVLGPDAPVVTDTTLPSVTNTGAGDITPPTVSAVTPTNGETNVVTGINVSATFSEAMLLSSIDTNSFRLTQGGTNVPGVVTYANKIARFNPAADLALNSVITVTITTGVKDLSNNALAVPKSWSFKTSASLPVGPAFVELGMAGDYVIFGKSGISVVPTCAIVGDIGLSPAAASFITGLSLTMDAGNTFATSSQITGSVFAADYTAPTPANLTTAANNMVTAYNDAAGRPTPDFTDLWAGDLSGRTLVPGLYKYTTGVVVNLDVTLSGGANDTWIFQIPGGLTFAAGKKVTLAGGAMAKNIVWQTAGIVTLNAGATIEGTVLSSVAINLVTGSVCNGRLLSQTAVNLGSSSMVTKPAP